MKPVSMRFRDTVQLIKSPDRESIREIGEHGEGRNWASVGWIVATMLAFDLYLYAVRGVPLELLTDVLGAALVAVLVFIWSLLIAFLSKRLFGSDRDVVDDLLYTVSLVFLACALLVFALSWLPTVGSVLVGIIILYGLFLTFQAVSSLTGLNYWRASVLFILGGIISVTALWVIVDLAFRLPGSLERGSLF